VKKRKISPAPAKLIQRLFFHSRITTIPKNTTTQNAWFSSILWTINRIEFLQLFPKQFQSPGFTLRSKFYYISIPNCDNFNLNSATDIHLIFGNSTFFRTSKSLSCVTKKSEPEATTQSLNLLSSESFIRFHLK